MTAIYTRHTLKSKRDPAYSYFILIEVMVMIILISHTHNNRVNDIMQLCSIYTF